jgi:hypothetical protein
LPLKGLLGAGALFAGAVLFAPLQCAAAAEVDSAAASSSAWRYTVSPYVWVATITGDFGADGAQGSTESDYSFWALENLKGYASVHFDARADKWGWFADALYVDYGDDFQSPNRTTSLGVKGEIYELGAVYALTNDFGFALVTGARDIDLKVSVALNPGPDGALSKAIVDPFVGVEYSHPLGEHWHVNARADYGGFNLESKSQKHVLATFAYRFSDRLTAFGGYRYLKVDFESTREVLRLTAAGPAFGFSWTW